jgi:hypothetical protein
MANSSHEGDGRLVTGLDCPIICVVGISYESCRLLREGARVRICSAAPVVILERLECLGKPHAIAVLLLMSELGRYHKS